MKKHTALLAAMAMLTVACSKEADVRVVEEGLVDHYATTLTDIPSEWLNKARSDLHIAYGHTSHGSQLTDGMRGLASFLGAEYAWNNGGTGGALDLHDYAMPGDLGNPNFTQWEKETRSYLDAHGDVNVIIWSWCGQVSSATEAEINTYLSLMTGLEEDYPGVTFVYMTGHLDGTGLTGNLHRRNEQIRSYCRTHKKFLYDFADIESYDPEGKFYHDKWANDGCYYDNDNNGSLESNWAIRWQESHTEAVDWYSCGAAHTQPLNANMKAYAAWHLWARIAGWDGK
ncbi:MAG: hypothetical protein P1P83_00130 [Bacteroidales bacterium]|nr:hypothetical protein [Bacteroidales bacterium]MDT8372435.1 hypothetical protein [Bacteroidales bacterium]